MAPSLSQDDRAIGGVLPFMGVMLITGAANTLLMKFMVLQQVPTGPGAESVAFDHPYFQSFLMMIGEFLCLIAYFGSSSHKQEQASAEEAPKYVFFFACLLDWTATTLVNMAYVLIAASVVQMMRGAIVIFTCLLSFLLLGRRQHLCHLLGVSLVFLGITLVSFSVFTGAPPSAKPHAGVLNLAGMSGIMLCILAQVFQASMLVYEESIMSKYPVPPLKVVGLEGTFGILIGFALLTALNITHVESTPAAAYQISHSRPLLWAAIASILSIAFFNYSGVTVTRRSSAVARSTIDVSRTILIWMVELALGWNTFSFLQLTGFVILALGTLIYNGCISVPWLEPPNEDSAALEAAEGGERRTLLSPAPKEVLKKA